MNYTKKRKTRNNKQNKELDRTNWPVVAICYDFDKTLSPEDMQNYSLIPKTGKTTKEFWDKCNTTAKENQMDSILSYMHEIIGVGNIESSELKLTRKEFNQHGKKIKLFNGVTTWFKRIEEFADLKKIKVEHYIISAGIQEIIEGTSIAKYFTRIFASSFYYNQKTKLAEWPAQIVNATTKTQYLFRISKNSLDMTDEKTVHAAVEEDKIRIPFKNIIYIGDSITDVPAMRVVSKEGGISIGVYNPEQGNNLDLCVLKRDKRINYFAPADYSKGGEMEQLVKRILENKALQFVGEEQTREAEAIISSKLLEIVSLGEINKQKELFDKLCRSKNLPKLISAILRGEISTTDREEVEIKDKK